MFGSFSMIYAGESVLGNKVSETQFTYMMQILLHNRKNGVSRESSATISRGYGAFSGKCVTVIMSVLSRREAVQLRRYAREIDPGAFITIVDSSEIVGKGFRGTN